MMDFPSGLMVRECNPSIGVLLTTRWGFFWVWVAGPGANDQLRFVEGGLLHTGQLQAPTHFFLLL